MGYARAKIQPNRREFVQRIVDMAKTAVLRGCNHFVSCLCQFVSHCRSASIVFLDSRIFTLSRLHSRISFAHARRGVVSVEYAVVIGTLAATIIAAFTGLAGRLLEILQSLTV